MGFSRFARGMGALFTMKRLPKAGGGAALPNYWGAPTTFNHTSYDGATGTLTFDGTTGAFASETSAITLAPGTYHFTAHDLTGPGPSPQVRVTIAGSVGIFNSDGTAFAGDVVVSTVSDQIIQLRRTTGSVYQINNIVINKTA
jgi:hypothetical protein